MICAKLEIPADPTWTVIFGPSGGGKRHGKSTILRIIAGLDRLNKGVIKFGGEIWEDAANQIFVTHDRTEAIVMDDRIAVMNNGRVLQIGSEFTASIKAQVIHIFRHD